MLRIVTEPTATAGHQPCPGLHGHYRALCKSYPILVMHQVLSSCEEGPSPSVDIGLEHLSYGGILSVTFLVVVTKYKGDLKKSQFEGVVCRNGEA